MYYQTTYDSPLGKVFIFCNDQHVKGVYFATQKLPKELAEIPCMPGLMTTFPIACPRFYACP